MSTGKKIRHYRKLRKITQAQLGKSVGLSESAIRNYELGLRTPNEDQLSSIADTLEVPVCTLQDYEITSAREVMEALFRLEEAVGLRPIDDMTLVVDSTAEGAQKLSVALKAWQRVLEEVETGEMSQVEYELWKASFNA